jgi:transcriptional regulator with XRE-family HTH domain
MNSAREIFPKQLGGRISRLREAEGWSRPALGIMLGVGRHCVGRWERGERRPPWRLLLRMAALFGTSIHELMDLPGSMMALEEEAKGEAI